MFYGGGARAMRGWLAGCGAATAVIYTPTIAFLVLAPGGILITSVGDGIFAFLFIPPLIFVITFVLSGIPATVTIWLSERFRIRSILFFGCAGAVTGALSQSLLLGVFKPWPPSFSWLFAVAGFAAGLAYWHVAGRYVGRDRDVPGESP